MLMMKLTLMSRLFTGWRCAFNPHKTEKETAEEIAKEAKKVHGIR